MIKKTNQANVNRWSTAGVFTFLTVITWLVFGQTLRHEFINYDDPKYVYANPVVTRGLTLDGVRWAFGHSHASNWHPLTSVSHMLDWQFFGSNAGGHHLTNVLLHSIAALLLFWVLTGMTGAFWRSAFVATVFSIHPLHVESVAWVAERKDVLSAIFCMLTFGAYTSYARQPSVGRYLTVVLLFAGGLMSKPMLVTLPFVLLLLDYWPLCRFAHLFPESSKGKHGDIGKDFPSFSQLILEKVPFLALSAGSCLVTLLVQEHAIGSMHLPLYRRIGNAFAACIHYVWQLFWPTNLAPFYPYGPDGSLPWPTVFASAAALVTITAAVFVLRKTRPYLLVGWCWYLGMLVPVIGLVQVGWQGYADRYTYLPHIGLYILATWGLNDLSASLRYQRRILAGAAILAIATLAGAAWKQASYWHDSESLWRRTLAVTSGSDVAHASLGDALFAQGRVAEAIPHFEAALQFRPESADNESRLGIALFKLGRTAEAIRHLQKVTEVDPSYAKAYYNLGTAFLEAGQIDESMLSYEKALEIQPTDPDAHNNFGMVLMRKGRTREALGHWQKALEIQPSNIGSATSLAWVLATCPDDTVRDGAKAVRVAEDALHISGGRNPIVLQTLAAAYAETGRFPDAIQVAERALELAAAATNKDALIAELQKEIIVYKASSAYRETEEKQAH